MTDADLDQSYTALCHALADAGEDKAQLWVNTNNFLHSQPEVLETC